MRNEIKELVMYIDQYLAGEIEGTILEKHTLNLISNDLFEKLDEKVQNAIYALDSQELNALSRNEMLEVQQVLIRWLSIQ